MLKHCLLAFGLFLLSTPINLFGQQTISSVIPPQGNITSLVQNPDAVDAPWQQVCGGGFVANYYSYYPNCYAPLVPQFVAPVNVYYPSFYQPYCYPSVSFCNPCPTCCNTAAVTSYYQCPFCGRSSQGYTQQSQSSPAAGPTNTPDNTVPKMPGADSPVTNEGGNAPGTTPPVKTYKYDGGSGAQVPVPNPTSAPQSNNSPLPTGPYQGYLISNPSHPKLHVAAETPLTFRAYGE